MHALKNFEAFKYGFICHHRETTMQAKIHKNKFDHRQKSKKYRESRNSSPCISLNSSIDDTELDTGNDTDASVVFNSSQLSSASNSSSCMLKQQHLKASSTQTKSHLKSVSVQNVVQCKSIQCQTPKL